MNLYQMFADVSVELLAKFKKTSQIQHSGGKGSVRESALIDFLREYLPRRYGVGRGEVVTGLNFTSGQLDVVIYDPDRCPILLRSDEHSIFPVESVYGALSVKSVLTNGELKDAYANIASLKKILPKSSFTLYPSSGFAVGLGPPIPATGIVAYSVDRSLDAVANQIKQLDAALPDISLRPDFVAIIGEGILGPREPLRSDFNKYQLPSNLTEIRKTKRHTLLRIYLQLLREMNAIELRPLELEDYLNMPELVGKYRVRRHNRFIYNSADGVAQDEVRKLTAVAIDKIVDHCNKVGPVTYRQHLMNSVGQIPLGLSDEQLNHLVYEFNPKSLPPLDLSSLRKDQDGRPEFTKPFFSVVPLEIDGKQYAVDLSSLEETDFEPNADCDLDELMSQ